MYLFLNFRRVLALLIFFYLPIYSQITGDLKIAFIRVSFISGDYPGFTGNGDFNYIENNFCEEYTIDPPPHDFNYFNSHVHAVNNISKMFLSENLVLIQIIHKFSPLVVNLAIESIVQ